MDDKQIPVELALTEESAQKSKKVKVSTYLDEEVVRRLKAQAHATGTRYQTLTNNLLRNAVEAETMDRALLTAIRQILREELARYAKLFGP